MDDPLENRTRRAGERTRGRASEWLSGRGLSGKTSVVLGAEAAPALVGVRAGVADAPDTENARLRLRGLELGLVGLRLLPMRSRKAPIFENIVK